MGIAPPAAVQATSRVRYETVRVAPAARGKTSLDLSSAMTLSWLVCPDCALGRSARQELWATGLSQHLALVLLPFILTAWASLLAYRYLDQQERRK
jgi:hypothetical protein